jgi:hypothetical protein
VPSATTPPPPVPPTLTAVPSSTAPAPSPTRAPSPTARVASPPPTLVPPTKTPSASISHVIAARVYVYDGPSANNSIIGGVDRGDELVVLGSRGAWYLVRINGPEPGRTKIEGGQGWIPRDQITPPSQPVPAIEP